MSRPRPHVRRSVTVLLAGAFLCACASPTGRPVDDVRSGPSTSRAPTADLRPGGAPGRLGSDRRLDELAEECKRGVLEACDDLVLRSDPGTRYEQYGATCGGRNEPDGSCVDLYAEPFSRNVSARSAPAKGRLAALADVRVAGQKDFDRFVLEFKHGGLPGYTVRYVRARSVPVIGDRAPLSGNVLLEATIDPPVAITGAPTRQKGDTSNIVEAAAVDTGDGTLVWAIALDRRTGFEVSTLDNPPRLVIDVSHR